MKRGKGLCGLVVAAALLWGAGSLVVAGASYTLSEAGRVSVGVYDAEGRLLRTLRRGEPTEPGTYPVAWDGLDRFGRAVAPGDYTWRMLAYPGIKAEYLFSFGTNTDWPAWRGTWVGNHMGPRAVVVDAENDWLYVVAGMGEGPPTIRQLSRDGTREGWYKYEQQFGQTAQGGPILYFDRAALAGGYLYVMAYGGRIYRIETASGRHAMGPYLDALYPGETRLRHHGDRETQENLSSMDLAATEDYLVVSYRQRNVLRVFERKSGAFLHEIEIDSPVALAHPGANRVMVAGNGRVHLVQLEDGNQSVVLEDPAIGNPMGIAVDPVRAQLLVAVRHQVLRYDLRTRRLVHTYGREGGRTFGRFEPADFRDIRDVAADGEGGFFVAEEVPRRVSRFAAGGDAPLREWFGGVSWGAMFTVDPERPEIGYSMPNEHVAHFMRFEINYEGKTWRPTHLHDVTHLPGNWVRGGRWQVKRYNDRMWLMFLGDVNPGIAPSVIEIDEGGDLFRPASVMGRLWWHQHHGGRLGWFEEADAAHEERTGRRIKAQHANAFVWLDRNGDGRVQPAEEITPLAGAPGWGHLDLDADWNLYVAGGHPGSIGEDGRAVMWHRIPLRADADGVPAWSWADAESVRAEVPQEFRDWGRSQANGVRLGPDGAVYQLWSSTQPGERGGGRHGNGWPHNEIGSVRLFKWNPDGAFVWAAGEQAPYKGSEKPGQIAQPRGILGVIGDRILIHDRAGRVCAAWTDDGLVAGSMFDRHADDGLPREWLYHVTGAVYPKRYLMGDDHISSGLVGLHDGRFVWMTPGQESTPMYELHDVTTGVRQSGPLRVETTPVAAKAEGTGLRAEYFDGPDELLPALTRLDPQLWFGARHLAVYTIPASPFFTPQDDPVEPVHFAANWQGYLEARFAETYRFLVETGGRVDQNSRNGAKVRVWVDDELILDHWDDVAKAPANVRTKILGSKPIALTPGRRVPIRITFENHGVDRPHLHLAWESPSQERQHVPVTALYPGADK